MVLPIVTIRVARPTRIGSRHPAEKPSVHAVMRRFAEYSLPELVVAAVGGDPAVTRPRRAPAVVMKLGLRKRPQPAFASRRVAVCVGFKLDRRPLSLEWRRAALLEELAQSP